MNPIGATILVGLGAVILLAPRRWALLALMAGVLCLTEQQAIEILDINLTALRFLEAAGLARVFWRNEFPVEGLNRLDRGVLLAYGYSTVVFLVRSDTGHAQMLGWMVDSTFCYFIFRAWIKRVDDLVWFLRAFAVLLVPYVALLGIEMYARENPFSLLGAKTWSSELRAGRIRCMGSFKHPALLGTLGAALLPLYIALALTHRNLARAVAGSGLCMAIVLLANSGGPVAAAAIGVVGWLLWVARTRMFIVRRIICAMLVMLALAMEAPVWYLPARISALTGGGGWHRSYLMDVAFGEFNKWWLAGMDAAETVHWFPYLVEATGAADITNAYLDYGLKSGLLTVVLFVLLLVRAYQTIGQALRGGRKSAMRRGGEYFLWGTGCALAVHIANWFAITYFDQIYVVWCLQLAAVSSLSRALEVQRRNHSQLRMPRLVATEHRGW
jgi:hypothetical protein